MSDRNRRFLLRERPSGRIGPDTFELTEEAVPEIGDGEALVRVEWISLDPTNRTWINDTPTYLPPVGIGEVMRGGGLGEVVASKNPNYVVGQNVQGLVGWQEYTVASDAMPLFPVDVAKGISPSAYMGALGMTGLTAWVGIRDIGKPQPGETVVVSAAAGAVGSVAARLAKADGPGRRDRRRAREVRAADRPAWIRRGGGPPRRRLGRPACRGDAQRHRYRLRKRRRQHHGRDLRAPQSTRARCALRSDLRLQLDGPAARTAHVRKPADPARDAAGFIVLDHFGRAPEAIREIAGLITEGRLTPPETVVEGFQQLPTAINMLFDGKNVGKLVVKTSG